MNVDLNASDLWGRFWYFPLVERAPNRHVARTAALHVRETTDFNSFFGTDGAYWSVLNEPFYKIHKFR
jgi:hypothetical protein